MRHIVTALIFIFSMIPVLVSCNKDNTDASELGTGAISGDSFDIPSTGGSFTVAFTSEKKWEITMIPDWLNASIYSGTSGTRSITFEARYNHTRANRDGKIIISATDGSFYNTITVRQPYPYLTIEPEYLKQEFTYYESIKGGYSALEIPVKSNVRWKIVGIDESSEFLYISTLEGEGDGVIEVLPKNNNFGLEPNSVSFNILPLMEDLDTGNTIRIPEEATDRYTVDISQDNFIFLLNGSPDELELRFSELDNPGTPAIVEIIAERPWSIAAKPDWIQTSTDGNTTTTLSINTDGITPTSEERNGVIVLKAEVDEPVTREITVSQDGYVLELSGEPDLTFACDDTLGTTVTLITSGPWKILDIPDWLHVSPTSGDFPGTYTDDATIVQEITIKSNKENLEFEPLAADIVFSRITKPANFDGNDPMDLVTPIVLEEFVFDIDPSPTLSKIPTFNTLEYPVTVNCSGTWEIETESDWLDISAMSGEKGTTTITVNANSANPNIEENRTDSIHFISVRHKDLGIDARRSIQILQRKYVFEIEDDGLTGIPAYKTTYSPYSANLLCSSEWEITECPDWLTPNITSGDGMEDVEIQFTPVYNTSSSSRSGTIRLKDNYTDNTITATATQDGFVFDKSEASFTEIPVMNEGSYPLTFEMTAEAPWRLSDYPDWVNPNLLLGNAPSNGSVTVTFRPKPNGELNNRNGTATLVSTITNEEKTIRFSQDPYVFDDSEENLHFTEVHSLQDAIYIECSGPWTIAPRTTRWVHFSQLEGSSSQTVRVTAFLNSTLSERNVLYVLTSTLNGLTKDINITQDAYKFDTDDEMHQFTTIDDKTILIDVVCSGGWTAVDVPEWVSLSQLSGNGNENGDPETIELSVSNNFSISPRDETMQIVSNANPSLAKEIRVYQSEFIIETSLSSIIFDAHDTKMTDVTVECSSDWVARANMDWVIISNVTSTSFRVSVENNDSATSRVATITVRNPESGLSTSITVTQADVFGIIQTSLHGPQALQ